MVSHRSGETPDTFVADLVVASGCGQLRPGRPRAVSASRSTIGACSIAAANPRLPYGRPHR